MSLYNGIDPVAVASFGVYTETYTSATDPGAIANLYVSRGLFEDAPNVAIRIVAIIMNYLEGEFKNG